MTDYISREAALLAVCQDCCEQGDCPAPCDDYMRVIYIPSADAVPKDAYTQVAWERDVALSQLADIGKGLGEKMDDVSKVVHGEWIVLDDCLNAGWYCSVCDKKIYDGHRRPKKKLLNYCPSCGARLDGGIHNV